MSGKSTIKKSRVYVYNSKWENESWAKGWLTRNKDQHGQKQAYCKICSKCLRAHVTDLQTHSTRESHLKIANSLDVKKQQKMTEVCTVQTVKEREKKERDLKLAVYIAAHSSIRSVDHLTDILNILNFKDLQLHKTKCGNLIKNVIAPNMLKELIEDIGNKPYSLIIDESTDVSTLKFLCLCIKYFSLTQNRVITDYLGLIQIEKADANSLHNAIINYCTEINLKIENLIGLGTDGGSNLCGKNHSVYTLLKAGNSTLQLVRCICHSLNNAASAAAIHFPANIEFLCREVYNWFSYSSLRKSEYKKTWDIINADSESDTEVEVSIMKENCEGKMKKKEKVPYHKFVQLSSTRWLARYNVVKVLLQNYSTLQSHFNLVVNSEKCYTARLLSSMLNDTTNYLFLLIIKPILGEINYVNASFQSTNVDLGCAYDDLKDLILLLARKILKPSFMTGGLELVLQNLDNELAYLAVQDADYGIDYKNALAKSTISKDQKIDIESRSFIFIKTMCLELSTRLPVNLKFYQQLKFLSPSVCLSQMLRPQFTDLPFSEEFLSKNKLDVIENQWNKLLTVEWINIFGKDVVKDSYLFWPIVFSFKNAGGRFVFRELAVYALTLLSFPSSNAVVERVFSIMNTVKTKLRNKMLLTMLDAILRIRMRFYMNNKCCTDFIPSSAMLRDFNYKTVYKQKNDENDTENANDIENENDLLEIINTFDK